MSSQKRRQRSFRNKLRKLPRWVISVKTFSAKFHNGSEIFQKAEYKTSEQSQVDNAEEGGEDISLGKYGNTKLIQSAEKHPERSFIDVRDLKGSVGKQTWVRGRVHTSRCKGKQCFLVLRQQSSTVQVLISVNEVVSKQMVKFSGSWVP